MRGWIAGGALVLVGLSCAPTIGPTPPPCTQTKRIIGRGLASNIVLLVDRSTPNFSQLQNALQVFATLHPTLGRYAVATYPHADACGPTDATDVLLHPPDAGSLDLDVDLQAQADRAVFQLATITPGGRSSLAGSLRFVGSMPELQDARRRSAVIVVTGSLPDCGADGGLDDTLAAIAELRQKPEPIAPVIVAFDADLTDAGIIAAFNALAEASGEARSCPSGLDSECGISPADGGASTSPLDTCDQTTKLCRGAFLRARDATELDGQLPPVFQVIVDGFGSNPCMLVLEWAPHAPADVSVYLDGQAEPRCDAGVTCDGWGYDEGSLPLVRLEGAACRRLLDATANDPATISVHIAGCDPTKDPRL